MTETFPGPTVVAPALAHHGLNLRTAREENVAFVCTYCWSIAAVTPTADSSREDQRDQIGWYCHEGFEVSI
jgi:hypothetical protein